MALGTLCSASGPSVRRGLGLRVALLGGFTWAGLGSGSWPAIGYATRARAPHRGRAPRRCRLMLVHEAPLYSTGPRPHRIAIGHRCIPPAAARCAKWRLQVGHCTTLQWRSSLQHAGSSIAVCTIDLIRHWVHVRSRSHPSCGSRVCSVKCVAATNVVG